MEQIPFILRTYHKHNSKPYIKREIPGDLTYKKKSDLMIRARGKVGDFTVDHHPVYECIPQKCQKSRKWIPILSLEVLLIDSYFGLGYLQKVIF